MPNEPRLRWGILGCARITRRGLIPGLRASSRGTLQALGSRDRATARAWADEFQVPGAHGSYREVIDDPAVKTVIGILVAAGAGLAGAR